MAVFRCYLRTFDGRVDAASKTMTGDQVAAASAYEELVSRSALDGKKIAAVLSYNNRQLAFHRFDRSPGAADYWRDKLDDIPWPGGVGRPAEMPGGKRVNVYLDEKSLAAAARLGDGNVSEGIRQALRAAESA